MLILLLNGALHYSTGAKRGLDVGFSSCTAPTSYSCPRIPEVSEVVQEFRSNLELECHPEREEHRGQV